MNALPGTNVAQTPSCAASEGVVWRHYSDSPVRFPLYTIAWANTVGIKPTGLWLSPGDEWREWASEHLSGWNPRYLARFRLAEPGRVRSIATPDEFRSFEDSYITTITGVSSANGVRHEFAMPMYPDWKRVTRDWAGISFVPYFQGLRFESIWYASIDVPSLCVWDPRCLELLGQERLP